MLDNHLKACVEQCATTSAESAEYAVRNVKQTFIVNAVEEVFKVNGVDPSDYMNNQADFKYTRRKRVEDEKLWFRIRAQVITVLVSGVISILGTALFAKNFILT